MFIIEEEQLPKQSTKFNFSQSYKDGILKSEYDKISRVANYDFDIVFSAEQKKIYVKENIVWVNKTKYSTKEILLHLYSNAYSNNETIFAKAYHLKPQNKTRLEISKSLVDGVEKNMEIIYPEIQNPNDSTVAKLELDKWVNPGDTVRIYFEYSLKIPIGVKRFGNALGRNFFFISQWFPKVGVFENGKWVCSQYHPYQNFYSDFGDYNAKIEVPSEFKLASTGVINSKNKRKKF